MQLSVNDITKSFGDKLVLKGVSFSAESGHALGLLGRNGAGKTTLIRIIMGVFGADSGTVLLDGKPLDRNSIKIGYLPEERGLYPKKKIMEQLIYFASLKGIGKKEAIKTADRLMQKLQVEQYKNAKLETLSKGNQQKIQLVATLICDPHIIILDEPFSGLDPVNASILKDIVKELIGEGKLVLFSSHQMNYIEEFCSSIVILNGGKIVLNGEIDRIKKSYPRNVVEIKSPSSQELRELIAGKGKDFIQSVSANDKSVTAELKNECDKIKLIRLLGDCGADTDEIKVKEPTLNEIFVSYTEGQV